MEREITRRGFLERARSFGAVGLTTAGLCVCILAGCAAKDNTPSIPANCVEIKADRVVINLDKARVLGAVGNAAKLDNPRSKERIIVIHAAKGTFVALSALCTHRGRPLQYEAKRQQLRCMNFGHSRFNLEGVPLVGPARVALQAYRTLYLGGMLEVFV